MVITDKWKETYDKNNKLYFHRSRNVSPDGMYFMFGEAAYINNEEKFLFHLAETQTGKLVSTPFSIPLQARYVYDAKNWTNDFIFEWVNENQFIATVPPTEGLARQGTYLYDLKSKEAKKLTSYVMNNCITLTQSGYVIFMTINGYIFKYKIDTRELTQMLGEPLINRRIFAFMSEN